MHFDEMEPRLNIWRRWQMKMNRQSSPAFGYVQLRDGYYYKQEAWNHEFIQRNRKMGFGDILKGVKMVLNAASLINNGQRLFDE
jgi:hypothetical protein